VQITSFCQESEQQKKDKKRSTRNETLIQSPCQFEKDEIDEFTGEHIIITTPEILQGNIKGNILFCRIGKIDNALALYFEVFKHDIFSMNGGEEILFKLTNDSIITLYNAHDFQVADHKLDVLDLWNLSFFSLLDEDMINTLLKYGIKMCRIYTSETFIDFTLQPEHYNNIQKLLKCVL
jgi:hypothetical protein